MKTVTRVITACSALAILFGAPALAAGPIDGKVNAVWWANDFAIESRTADSTTEADALGLTAELWVRERYGVRASQFSSEPDDGDGADYTSVDVMWKALAPTENNFVAVGLGWQQMDVQGLSDSTSGARVTVDGRVGILNTVYAYGHGSYLPSLSDSDATESSEGSFQDLYAYEYEVGVAWNAMPFMDLRAGYRVNSLSFTQAAPSTFGVPAPSTLLPRGGTTSPLTGLDVGTGDEPCPSCGTAATLGQTSGDAESSGFYLGVGVRF